MAQRPSQTKNIYMDAIISGPGVSTEEGRKLFANSQPVGRYGKCSECVLGRNKAPIQMVIRASLRSSEDLFSLNFVAFEGLEAEA